MYFSFIKLRFKIFYYVIIFFLLGLLFMSIKNISDFRGIFILFISGVVFEIVCIVYLIWYLFFGYFSYGFYIDETGVTLIFSRSKKYHLQWKEINVIGLARNRYAAINKHCFIYFDGRDIDNLFRMVFYNFKDYNNKYFGVQYRKKVADEIRKYWDEPIQGIYQIEGKGRL